MLIFKIFKAALQPAATLLLCLVDSLRRKNPTETNQLLFWSSTILKWRPEKIRRREKLERIPEPGFKSLYARAHTHTHAGVFLSL